MDHTFRHRGLPLLPVAVVMHDHNTCIDWIQPITAQICPEVWMFYIHRHCSSLPYCDIMWVSEYTLHLFTLKAIALKHPWMIINHQN